MREAKQTCEAAMVRNREVPAREGAISKVLLIYKVLC